MKKTKLVIIVVVALVLAYLVGFLHGNRSAAIVCLEQAAADTHAGYKMLTDPKLEQWRDGTHRMLLGAARRALVEEKKLLQNPLRPYHKRRGPYEVRRGSAGEEVERIDELVSEWDAVLTTNHIRENTEPAPRPVP